MMSRATRQDFANEIKSSLVLRQKLLELSKSLQEDKRKVNEKTAFLQSEVKDSIFQEALQLPHEPFIKIYGFDPEKCFIFKSAIMPMRLAFNARVFPEDWKGGELPPMTKYFGVVKNGDDLRQD